MYAYIALNSSLRSDHQHAPPDSTPFARLVVDSILMLRSTPPSSLHNRPCGAPSSPKRSIDTIMWCSMRPPTPTCTPARITHLNRRLQDCSRRHSWGCSPPSRRSLPSNPTLYTGNGSYPPVWSITCRTMAYISFLSRGRPRN